MIGIGADDTLVADALVHIPSSSIVTVLGLILPIADMPGLGTLIYCTNQSSIPLQQWF